MGGSESKASSSDHDLWTSDEDRLRAKTVFNEIAHGHKTFTKEQFLHFTTHISDAYTSSRIFDLFLEPLPHRGHQRQQQHHHSTQHQHHEVNQHSFMAHLGFILNGSISDMAKIVVFLASITPSQVSSTDLVHFVSRTIAQFQQLLHAHCVAYQSWMFSEADKQSNDRLAVSLLAGLLSKGDGVTKPFTVSGSAIEVDSRLMLTQDDVEAWLEKTPFFRDILQHSFIAIFQFYESQPGQMAFSPRLPQVQDTNWSRLSTILDFPTVLYLNQALPSNLQRSWRLLFSNHSHGGSFSQLVKRIQNQGPTVLVIRDHQGSVFGGFASKSWEINPKFQGDESCFLFQAKPRYAIYPTTGYNTNYMYMNYHMQTLPNGVGMGGQLEYFGLWIDQTFDVGHSKAGSKGCSTYGSPPLAQGSDFKLDTLEVWAVGKVKRNEDDLDGMDGAEGGESSILDKLASEDKAILDMVDRGTISDAIRAEPIVKETAAHNTIISPF